MGFREVAHALAAQLTADAGLTAATAPAKADGLQVALGGEVPESVLTVNGAAGAIGVVVALIVLVLALRSLAAAGLPLLVAIAGLTGLTVLVSRQLQPLDDR